MDGTQRHSQVPEAPPTLQVMDDMQRHPQAPEAPPTSTAAPAQEALSLSTAELPASTELLAYYRTRLGEFEQELSEAAARTSAIEVSHEELHRTQWELKVRHEEVAELQRALSDANVYLFDEREQVLKLQAENDQLKIQELEDRRRIQHLLALTQPVSQEVTFFRDCRPAKMTRFPVESSADGLRSRADGIRQSGASRVAGRSGRLGKSKSAPPNDPSARSSSKNSSAATQPFKSRVLRTIYLPSEKADTLLLTVESLQKQLSAVKELEAGRNAALLEDRRKRNEEERARAVADREKIERLEETIRKIEGKTREVTKTYLEQRHEAKVSQRVAKEEIEMLRSQNQRLVEQLQEERRRFAVEIQSVRNAAEQESKVFTESFRREALAREEDLSVLKEQYAEVQRMSQTKISDLEKRLKTLSKKHRQLEQRRSMDFEGFGNDITVLRKQVAMLESFASGGTPKVRRGISRKGRSKRQRSKVMSSLSASAIGSFVTEGDTLISDRGVVRPEKLEEDLSDLRARIAGIESMIA